MVNNGSCKSSKGKANVEQNLVPQRAKRCLLNASNRHCPENFLLSLKVHQTTLSNTLVASTT